jgi:type IV pilus assembly protein PilB
MATPNDAGQPKKPTPGATPQPGSTGTPRPAQQGQGTPRPVQPQQQPQKQIQKQPAQQGAEQKKVPVDGEQKKVPAEEQKKVPGQPQKKTATAKAEKKKETGKRKLGQVLVDLGFIDENQLWELLDESRQNNQLLGQTAVNRGLITEDQLYQALAEEHNLKLANLAETKPSVDALALVPETMANVYKILPLTIANKVLTVVIGDPNALPGLDDLKNLLNLNEVIALLAPPAAIAEALTRVYAGKEESITDILSEIEKSPELGKKKGETSIDLESMVEMSEAAPVRKLINMVFLLGIRDKASDIHFEPFEDEYKIRMRCDGVLYEMVPPPRHLAPAIASRIKVMSNLDIAERRVPQDGRIELNVGGNPVDMRVSVLPTMFGESVVIRVLDRTVVSLDLNKVGMDQEMLTRFRHLIHKPNGIVLVTGPTGAGKTTTLYSALNELNTVTDKLITTEDPVEYDIDGIIQVPINHEIGLTFASALRSILRQDPDRILVGEIRDLETAQIAVQASLTGHMVFSTLHTNDAPSSITRLRDMGLEPYLITATLEGILAQRLVRRICEDCRTEFEPSPEMLMELNLRPEDVKGKSFFYGRGCDRCNNTGHRGRMGLFELVEVDDDVRDLISSGASTEQLQAGARRKGMQTLRESGLKALWAGKTTIEEVVRETVLEDDTPM